VTAALVLACSLACFAREETTDELKAKAEAAKLSEQAKLCVEIARRQLDAADKAYASGQMRDAQVAIKDVVSYSEKAGQAAQKSGKHLKPTEIELRKISRRLKDIKPTLNVDDRPPIQEAIDRLEHVRSELLMSMFSTH
jgi:hypothetical protein